VKRKQKSAQKLNVQNRGVQVFSGISLSLMLIDIETLIIGMQFRHLLPATLPGFLSENGATVAVSKKHYGT